MDLQDVVTATCFRTSTASNLATGAGTTPTNVSCACVCASESKHGCVLCVGVCAYTQSLMTCSRTLTGLHLYLVADTECTAEYVFAFVVSNMKTYQESPTIYIGASFVGSSAEVFEHGISIAPAKMDDPIDPEHCNWCV